MTGFVQIEKNKLLIANTNAKQTEWESSVAASRLVKGGGNSTLNLL